MRARPILLVSLFVLWGTTWLGPALADAADPGQDAAPAMDLVIQTGTEPPERVHLRLVDRHDDSMTHELTLDPEADQERVVRLPLGPGAYHLSMRTALLANEDATIYHPSATTYRIDLTECALRSRITVHLDHRHLSVHHDDTGCLDMPPAAERLMAAAHEGTPTTRDTRPAPPSEQTPTRGVFVATDRLDADPDDPAHAPGWGDELLWFDRNAAAPLLDVATLPPDSEWLHTLQARGDDAGNARGAWTEGLVAYHPDTGTIAASSHKGLSLAWKDVMTPAWQRTTLVEYHAGPRFPECLAVVPTDTGHGHTVQQLADCIGAPGHAAWRLLESGEDVVLVATWPRTSGAGLATVTYNGTTANLPSRVHVYDRNDAGIVTHTAAWLDPSTLRYTDTPAAQDAGAVQVARWHGPERVPLDPMRGPVHPDPTRDPFAFSLAAAADAARADPLLGPRIDAIEARDGILAGAVYQHDPTLTRVEQNIGTEVAEPVWALLFARGPATAVAARCHTTPAPVADPDATPQIQCRPDDEDIVTRHLGNPPLVHERNLPGGAPSWSSVANAWQPLDDAPSPRLALYRAWHEGPAPHERAFLSAGHDLRHVGADAPVTGDAATPSEVRLELATGQPIWHRTLRLESRIGPDIADAAPIQAGNLESETKTSQSLAKAQDANLITVITFITGLAIIASAAAWHRLPFQHLRHLTPAVALWARRHDARDRHPIRVAIVEHVTEQPGIIRARLKSHLRVRNGQLDHHLGVLLARGEIFEIRERGARCFFRTGSVDNEGAYRLAALANPRLRAARDLVRSHPGVTVTGLADALDVSKGHASRIVHRLADTGHIRIERDANRLRAFPREAA